MGSQDRTYEEIGQRIKLAREEAGLTQDEVAARLGMSSGGYSLWETGKRRVPINELRQLAKMLGKPTAWFWGEEIDERRVFAWRLNELSPERQQFVRQLVDTMLREQGTS